jgi:hypothetical protein
VGWIRYPDAGGIARALDDASALADEAGAASFVLIRVDASGVGAREPSTDVMWLRTPGRLVGEGRVDPTAEEKTRAEQVARIFHPPQASEVRPTDQADIRTGHRRIWADYALGGGLVAVGTALSIPVLMAIARNGECANAACSRAYDGHNPRVAAQIAVAGALAMSGVVILWVGPFGRRYGLQASTGAVTTLRFRGQF